MAFSAKTSAEARFRDAFERLKTGQPQILPAHTPVSQNNVAREAGTDPTALRKARFPGLVREIQAWVDIHDQHKEIRAERQRRRKAKEDSVTKVKRLTAERDNAQSQLVSAHRLILELLKKNESLEARMGDPRPPATPLQD